MKTAVFGLRLGGLGLGLGLAAASLLGGCTATTAQQETVNGARGDSPETVAAPAGVETIAVTQTAIPDYLEVPAHIEADPTKVVHVFPPAGGRIVQLSVRPWDAVQSGETLAMVESGDLSRAVAEYHKARTDYGLKQKVLERSMDLLAHRAIAEKDYQQAQADAESAQAELEATREQIRVFGMDPDNAASQLRVTAPRSGVILDVGAAPGEYSTALQAPQPLCTIADLSNVWAVGDIYEKDLSTVRTGDVARVLLDAYPRQTWNGRVSTISDTVDPNTRTLHLRVVLANDGTRLKPAMFGSIRLLRSSRQAIAVPGAAVVREGNAAYVFVSAGNGSFQRRNVVLGQDLGSTVEVTSGLKPGETIATQGALLLRAPAR